MTITPTIVLDHTISRTITLTHYEPWLLGWCRWEISTTVGPYREVLASGRWKWRGRKAEFIDATVHADKYWHGSL